VPKKAAGELEIDLRVDGEDQGLGRGVPGADQLVDVPRVDAVLLGGQRALARRVDHTGETCERAALLQDRQNPYKTVLRARLGELSMRLVSS
jgi:hypothetical protein